jgi:DNA polymerase III epsilon subunit-like protein
MIFCFDTETTGLPRGSVMPRICQIGIVRAKWVPVANDGPGIEPEALWIRQSFFVNPEIPDDAWEEKAIEITGIGPDQVRDAPTFFEIYEKISRFAFGCDTMVGYNLAFDADVLAHELEIAGAQRHFPWPMHHIDMMPVAADYLDLVGKRGNKSPTLEEALHGSTEHKLTEAHDGLADALATMKLFCALRPTA